ncbi:hypothetical protein K505DRAFT_110116 [Melanomma pulvis-pyrius CBS 109.77]|uniref:Uncharacterized protein n=1 Tax=Melanomma pulvis-pyrius CBS 109.77 TaxID=1314802 RepID=A0A6A6WVZ3_9PLEO|nr:hypothetical protein K505DRAFT_110116 [Melanomma pulvis-pyrius CBS 109.77]
MCSCIPRSLCISCRAGTVRRLLPVSSIVPTRKHTHANTPTPTPTPTHARSTRVGPTALWLVIPRCLARMAARVIPWRNLTLEGAPRRFPPLGVNALVSIHWPLQSAPHLCHTPVTTPRAFGMESPSLPVKKLHRRFSCLPPDFAAGNTWISLAIGCGHILQRLHITQHALRIKAAITSTCAHAASLSPKYSTRQLTLGCD